MRIGFRIGSALLAVVLASAAAMAGGQDAPEDRWGPRVEGRWWAGDQAPGGWRAYRTPVPGFILPGYWMQPAYDIPDYAAYGLPAPPPGYTWSRYYDDAVLSDQYGKVRDARIHFDWDAPSRFAQDPEPAMAPPPVDDREAHAAAPTREDRERLRAERRLARETARQDRDEAAKRRRLDRMAQDAGYSDYDDYRHARDGRTAYPQLQAGGPGEGRRMTQDGGYIEGGYYYPPPLVTTIRIDPDGTTHVTNPDGSETVTPR